MSSPTCAGLERLGRRQHDERPALREPLESVPAFGHAQAAVEPDHGQTAPLERLLLVGHQRDEGRYDDRGTLEQQCRRLVEKRFAVAGRQHGQHVPPVEDGA